MVRSARASMTPEQIETLEKSGEYMYGQVDYETSTLLRERNIELEIAVESLKAGFGPEDLSEEEIEVLKKEYGKHWKDRFDISSEE